ncbi:YadA-like family protein [Actinobacillus equuli subsp. haemolyticus]|uniref:YadA-like family protein n=1 Tax=Actinobacillus equuli TaxID=718 RepID=UPI002443470A|nr:YadA-like family protein [Actinobacillus equuli]WGE62399.1 YadA-like family protein [Actinobacillus equuli subsp. haemolyticus]
MNHVYKVVWSTVTNSLVVVSELARSKGKAASTVSDVKDVSNKTAAVAVAAALQVAAVGTIAIGSFAPMEANAIVAISHAENGQIQSTSAQANASTVVGGRYYGYSTIDEGTRAYNYNNPGSLSYDNASSNDRYESGRLYDSSKYVHGIAIGCNTNAVSTTGKGGSNGIAIGDYSKSTGGLSMAIGALSQATDIGAMALGTASRASGFNSLSMMRQSAATGDYSVAIGSVSYAKGDSSFAMGSSATAFGNQSIAIGSVSPVTYNADGTYEAKRTSYDAINRTQTNGDRSMALGSGAKTSGDDSFAVGSNATTGTFTTSNNQTTSANKAAKAIAFGNDSEALKDKAVAFGNNATAKGEESVAFGFNATSVGNQSVAIGTNSNAAHDRVVTIGTNSTATHNRSMAIGEDAEAKANHSLALGANATVTVANSVSLGADSFADEIGGSADMQINGKTYKFAGGQAQGTVSVGSGYDKDQARSGTVVRTITDLGAGRVLANSTDAINGSQLYAVVTEINKGWNVATNATAEGTHTGGSTAKVINGETVTFTAGKNIAINQQDKNITVKTEDDVAFNSVNTKDLTATGNTKVNNFTVENGGKVDMGGNTVTNIGAPKADNDATTKKYVDDGRTQVVSTDKSVTITNSTTNGATVYDLKVNANVSYEGDSGKGTNKLSDPIKFAGVAGETVTTATNGQVTVGLDKKAKDSLAKADTAVQTVLVGAGNAAQSISVDQNTNRFDIVGTDGAVTTTIDGRNVKVDIDQKFKDTVNTNTQNIANNAKNITNNTNNITKNAEAIAKGFGLEDENGTPITKALGEKVRVVGGNQNINTAVTADGKLAINLNNTLDLGDKGSVKIGDIKVDQNGLTITGGPSVTKTGIDAGNQKITKVQDGEVSENSKEAVNGSQLYATNQNVTNNTNSINSLNTTVQAGWELQVEGKTVKNVTPKNKNANFKAGDNIVVSDDSGSVKIATKSDVTFDKVTAKNGLTVNQGATINMGDNVVSGVANGTVAADSKQAVNGSQLFATNQNVTNLENKVNGGFGLKATDGKTVTKQLGDTIEVVGGDKNISTTVTADNKLTINLNKDLDLSEKGSVKIGDTTINNGGLEIAGGPSVKKDGINAGDQKITKVKAGDVNETSTDAVNGSQLHQTNQNVTNLGDKLTAEGLNFVGDNGQVVHRDLGATLSVVGGAKADLSENNIGVEGKDGTLTVKLAKTLNDLTSATFTTNGQGKAVIDGNGVTITPSAGDTTKTVSLTNNGLNNGGNRITNVAEGKDGTDAVNVDQLNKVSLAANAGWKLQANNTAESTVKPNDAVSLNNTDNNIVITKKAGDNNVTFGLNNTVKVGTNNAVTIDGTNGTVGGLTNKTFDPNNIVSGQAATEDQLQSSHNTLKTNITNLGNELTDKGLNFVGDNGKNVHRKLGDTLSVVGGAEEANLSDKNIGVVGSEGKLEVKLAKTLKDLTNATFTNGAGNNGNTVIDGKGVTITSANGGADKTVSLTDKGLNNGGNTITNVAAGVNKTDAVNVSQLEKVNATAKAGWNLAVNDDAKGSNIAPNATVRLNNKDGNIKVTKEGNNVTFDLNNTVKVGTGDKAVTINGTDGTVTGLTNKTFTPGQIVSGRAATEDQLQSSHDQLNTNITNLGNNLTEKGLSFSADNKGAKVHRKLGETLSVVGHADPAKLSDKNIGVEANEANGQLVVKLAKELTDLTSANFTATGANTTINGNGVTIKPATGGDAKTVSLTDKGLNNGGNNITNVANGTADTDAVNVSQLKEVSSTANAGWNLTVNGTSSSNVAPKATVDLANKDGNIVITKDNNNVTFALNSNLTVGGKDGKDGSIGVNGKDGSAVVLNGKDGSIGLTGPKGADGKSATATITVAKGPVGVDGKDGANGTDGMTRIVYTDPNGTKHNVSTLNDGLSFVGNTGGAVAKKLNETLTIKGALANADAATAENIRVDNVGGDLIVKLAQNLTNLTTATFGKDTNDQLVINKDGLTIKPTTGGDAKTVSLTENGLNNGNNIITNVSSGLVGNDGNKVALKDANGTTLTNAVNVGDLQNTVKDLTNATTGGFGLKDSAGNEVKQDLGTSIKVTGKDGVNAQVVTDGNGKALQIGLNSTVTVGKDNEPGVITVKGENGKDGVSINGKDGTIGLNGKDGANGSITVKNGQPGVDGKDGKTRIVYETKTPDGKTTTEEVATLNDGLKFVGDKGEVIAKKLNDTLAVKGNLAKDANVTDKNLRVDNEKDELIIKMAKELKDLTNATFTSADSNTTIGGNGVTITPNTGDKVSLTDKGLNNGNNTITNVAEGKNGTDAVNVNQLERVNATANAGWNISANGANSTNVGPKGNVSLNNTDGNIVITKGTTDNNVTFALNNNLTVGKDGKDGKDGIDGQIGVNGKDGSSVVLNGKDGSIGLTGPRGTDGKDGASANISVADGKPGLDGKDGETKTRIVYETKTPDGKTTTEQVATLNDGLNFIGNQGEKIAKKLNDTLAVKGSLANDAAASSENVRVDSQDGALVVKLAQNLANLTTATFGNTATDKTVVGKDGVTISADKPENTVSLTDKGLNNGNNQITNVTSGLTDASGNKADLTNAVDTNAVNVGDLKETVKNITTDGFGLKDDKGTEVKQDLGKTIQIKGKDGVTVTADAADKALVVALEGDVVVNGKDGKDGTIGVKGADGKDGTTITKDAIVFNGIDGVNGKDGKDGAEGKASIKVEKGAKGIDGNDGKDGESKTRIVYEKPNGDKEEVATLNDGLHFVGDNGEVIAKKLNETLAIKGNLTSTAEVTDKNLRVDNEGGQLIVKMAKVLTDLTSATFTDAAGNNTIIGGNGVTITPKAGDSVSLTDKGLNNGNNTITNVKAGLNGTDAVNVNQLEKVNATAKAGWKLTNNGTNESTVTPNATVDLANKDGNIIITKDGNNVTFGFNSDLTVGGPGKDGKDGKDGTIGVKGKDGTTGVTLNGKDGSIGINGKDGSNGAITVEKGAVGVDGTDGANGKDGMTRIVYTDANGTKHNVSTLNDGLSFVGNDGKVIAKKLNSTLTIKGGLAEADAATAENIRVDNVNGDLIVKLAQNLTNLTTATFGNDVNDQLVINKDGLTIKGADAAKTVSLTDKGLNNGNNQITNVTSGLVNRNGDKVDLANATGDVLTNAVNVGDLKESVNNLTNATTGGFGLTDENNNDVKADLGKTVTVIGDGSVKTEVVEKDGKKALQIGLTSDVTVGNDKEPGVITVKGENGKDGVSISGKDGISIKGENGQDAVSINGKDGNGAIAVNGKDGKTGVGLDGANGTIGINGKDGSNGTITVKQGKPGVDGKDGETKTRIVYETPNGEPEEVATLNDGLKFVGDDGKVVTKKLNETLTIKGNLSTAADVTDNNLRVDNVDGALIIKMARTLTDLTSATFTNVGGDKSVVDGNGLTITPVNGGKTVSLTTKGLDNGGNKVINVAAGDVNATSTDAVNGSQLYAVSEVANKGWNIQTNGNVSTNVKPGDTVNFANGKNIEINNDGTNVTVGLAKDVDLGKDGSIKAGDTIMNNDGVKVGDKVSLTKDGLTAGDVKISAETGINAGNKQITNVESGLGGTKLADAKGDTLKNAANIGDLQTAISSVTDAEQGGGFGLADDNGTEVKQSLGKTIQVKGDGNVTTTVTNGSLTVGLNKDVDLGKDGSLTAGGTKVSEKGVSFADSLVNLTSNGLNNGGNKVTNVKAGEVSATSTDAVNGSQLHATNQNVTNLQNNVAKGWNIEAGTVEGSTGKVTGASKSNVAMGDTVGVKAGNNIEITQDGSNIAIATSATPTFDTVTVGKDGNTATVGTVQDEHGSAIKVTGADGKSETRINNVADGKADNDAVNVRQLKGVAQNVANIDNRVSKLDKRVRGIGANSAAASSLPQVMLPGKSMVAVAGGAYSGASAVAVGYSRASDNGKVILKVNGTANSAGHYSGGVGVGYQW